MKLTEAIDLSVSRRRYEGAPYISGEITLRLFCKLIGNIPLNHLCIDNIAPYLNHSGVSPSTLRSRYSTIGRFLKFWQFKESLPRLILPRPPREDMKFVPHIYTEAELRSLLRAAARISQKGSRFINGETYRTILLTLYATGAVVSEVVNLRIDDLDLKRPQLQLPGNYRANARCIPINRDLYQHLRSFSLRVCTREFSRTRFFQTIDGKAIDRTYLCYIFGRLRDAAGVLGRNGARRPPRMQDFRATFAVHRLVSWIRQGADLNRMIPALSTYMGYPELAAEKYLAFAPERFREQLNQLSPNKRKRHWRNDPELMRFLSNL